MKKVCAMGKRLKWILFGIPLVDRWLLLILLVLLGQSAFSLFFPAGGVGEADSIDVIIRTSAAGIFGYVLSTNFLRGQKKNTETQGTEYPEEIQQSSTTTTQEPQAKIGFLQGEDQSTLQMGKIEENKNEIKSREKTAHLQIVCAGVICLFCLFCLLLLRNSGQEMEASTATVAQFRDFISGGVGFLIGCPGESADQS